MIYRKNVDKIRHKFDRTPLGKYTGTQNPIDRLVSPHLRLGGIRMISNKNAFRFVGLVIALALLTIVALPARTAHADTPPTALVKVSRANVYAGPGTGFWVLGTLRQNVSVPVIGVVDGRAFWKVNSAVGVGYVRAEDVTVTGQDKVEVIDPGPIGRVTAAGAVVRGGPGPEATRLGTLVTGAQFFVLSAQADGSWIEILFTGGRGWINASLTTIGIDGIEDLPAADGPIAIVNVSFLNVRSGPGLQYTRITTLAGSSQVPIIGKNSNGAWLLVTTKAGDGWINASQVITRNYFGNAPVVDPTKTNATLSYQGTMTISANLRAGPGLTFDSLGVVADGSTVKVLGQSRDRAWWYVETALGKGWLNKTVVRTERDFSDLPFSN